MMGVCSISHPQESHLRLSSGKSHLLALADLHFKRIVLPSLVPIYASHSRRPVIPEQVGTGFLLAYKGRPVLVTAKHVLRGKCFSEKPAEKAVHINGRWVYIGDGGRELVEPERRDLTVAYLDEFPLHRCLMLPQFASGLAPPRVVTMAGYLARDFRRHGAVLMPAPRTYTGLTKAVDGGLIGLRYPYRRNADTNTGRAVVTPRPAGLSGGPIIDTAALVRGTVVIVGAFTEQSNGEARGEKAYLIERALEHL